MTDPNNTTPEAVIRNIDLNAIFTVVFLKKDGSVRQMNCRRHVVKHLAGGVKTFNGVNNDRGNIGVWDMQKQAYRCFHPESVLEIRANHTVHKFSKGDEQ